MKKKKVETKWRGRNVTTATATWPEKWVVVGGATLGGGGGGGGGGAEECRR